MSERGLPIADGASACPFVAFEDDRDERAAVPDHRHRCYAEVRPAPRALAHQEAYCLSSAFPVCPTFQDWARREAARARVAAAEAASTGAPAAASMATPGDSESELEAVPEKAAEAAPDFTAAEEAHERAAEERSTGDDEPDEPEPASDEGPRRNPPRDWSAPPPWLASAEAGGAVPSDPPDFLAGRSDPTRGLAGSAADILAGGSPPRSASRPIPPPPPMDPGDEVEPELEEREPPRSNRPRRPRAYDQHLGGPTSGPDWERPRRYEAYPTIKARMSLPAVPRLVGMAGAVAIAAVALFFLPALLGLGSSDEPRGSATPSAAPSRSIEPTPIPPPTPTVYIIKKGDTLSKVATANGITLDELLAANPAIKDPNRITEGQQITIPAPSQAPPEEFGGSAEPSSGASP